jgi:putative ABC transport system permease protein
MLFRLALRNIFRQRARSAVTLAAIVFGVSGLIVSGGFVKDIFIQLGEAIIHSQTGHAQVFKHDFMERGTRQPERFLIAEPEPIAGAIAALPMVEEVSARMSFSGLLNNGRRDLAIFGEGVEPEKEARIGSYMRYLQGRPLTDDDLFGIVVGEGVAQSLGLTAGDQATLVVSTAEGALNTLDVEVLGIFESFSREYDARAVRITLAASQKIMATPGANTLVISLHETSDTDAATVAVAAMLPAGLEVRNWTQLSDFYEKTLMLYERQFGILQFIILVMVLLSVANTVNMSAFERQGEFGTLQALGNRRRDIFKLVVIENTLLGLLGAIVGVLVGTALALAISAVGIPMPPPPNTNSGYTALIRLDAGVTASAFVIGLVATTLASLFPARKVSRTPIVDALRQNT